MQVERNQSLRNYDIKYGQQKNKYRGNLKYAVRCGL